MKIDLKALKMRVDLVAVIQAHGVPLKQKGANFVARCPFKPEKTASFTVSPAKRIFKCFGCDAKGDVFKFLELKAGLKLPQAIEWLQGWALETSLAAREAGVTPTLAPIDAPVVERAPEAVLDRVIAHWQKELGSTAKAQAYLKARGLWHPVLLRALKVGYASGSLARALPGGGTLRRQLTSMGILNEKTNEFFYDRIVIPIVTDGVLTTVYGRAISPTGEPKHLYLKGPRRGVFNLAGISDAAEIILTESPLDAISLMVLRFTRVTTSYGAGGFTADIRAQLVRSKTTRVYCVYDPDPAGNQAADKLAHDLASLDIEVLRVALPASCKDPNDFLKGGGTQEQFQTFLDAARPVIEPQRRPQLPAPEDTLPAVASPAAASPVPRPDGLQRIERDGRIYEVLVLVKGNTFALRVRLKVVHQGRAFIDTLNLYMDAARQRAAQRVKNLFGPAVPVADIEADLLAIAEAIEAQHRQGETPPSPTEAMTDEETAAALALLTSPDLVGRIRSDLTRLGVVGEDRAKLLVYLVATSRRQKQPLSLVVVSRSSAGKSFIVTRVMEMMPEEETCAYARLSAKALFHDETDRLKHKLLVIEEAQGMHEAAYALRVMQSNHMLKSLSTITDPATGRHKAQENIVYGPVALIVTTTEELDFETLTRAFVISVDESEEQTSRIHQMQRQAWTLDGLAQDEDREKILVTHRNAQRLLKPLAVVNAYAQSLTFPTGTLRLRREHAKYLALIAAITDLYQYQRVCGVHTRGGQSYPYVETIPADIDLANELVVMSLQQAFEEVTSSARELLRAIRELVAARAGDNALTHVTFTRRDLREHTKWADHPIREHLKILEGLEYVCAVSGRFGKEYVYALSPDHLLALDGTLSLDEEIRTLGLTGARDLAQKPNGGRKG